MSAGRRTAGVGAYRPSGDKSGGAEDRENRPLNKPQRDGAKQARLARLLRDVKVEPITREDGYRAGVLLGVTRTKDVVDAAVTLLAKAKDLLYTSDPGDLQRLCTATGFRAVVIGC